jgi:hypothetical protein
MSIPPKWLFFLLGPFLIVLIYVHSTQVVCVLFMAPLYNFIILLSVPIAPNWSVFFRAGLHNPALCPFVTNSLFFFPGQSS